MEPVNFDATCRYIGKLFLDCNHQLEAAQKTILDLREKLTKAEQERDQALQLVGKRP